MTTPDVKPVSAGRKAVSYAEDTLGVNEIHLVALTARTELDASFTKISELKDFKRNAEQKVSERELELIGDEHGRHPELSVAAMERHLKLELPKDPLLRELRGNVTMAISDIEGVEYDIRVFEADVRIAVARLNELGGYLTYLAAVKSAETARLGHKKTEIPE